jgi:glycosyltransferase involved in cell wall biosynthesis
MHLDLGPSSGGDTFPRVPGGHGLPVDIAAGPAAAARADRDQLAGLPDALLARPERFAPGRRPRLVVTGYGGSLRSSFSGSSYHLTQAGIETGLLDGGLTLYSSARHDRRLDLAGARWKARRVLARQRSSGFKFSPEFSTQVWHRHLEACAGTDLVNNFQLYSPEVFARRQELGIRTTFYLDGTFSDYLRGYRAYDVRDLDDATVDQAIAAEAAGYEEVGTIAVMSRQVATSLQQTYGVDPARIDVILPGANLSDQLVDDVARRRADRPETGELTIGFVGVYPERKGLPKLAAAIARLRQQHVPVRLLVVGRCPPDIAAQEGVESLGVLDKAREPDRFAAALARIDLGCQLSTVEMWGIAALEFVRCGIPVLATEVGGIPDMIGAGGTVGLPPDVRVEQVSEAIRALVEDHGRYERLAAGAAAAAPGARWERTAARLAELLEQQP